VYAFALLLSTLTAQPFAALAGGVGFAFVSRALDNVPGLHSLSPWLPVTDASTTAWTGLLDRPVATGPINHLLIVQGVYASVLGVVAFLIFTRRDIMS
jgi:ABC-2 type transport system permease protein